MPTKHPDLHRLLGGLLVIACIAPSAAECPSPDDVLERIRALGLERSARVARFESTPPDNLYIRAARKSGQPVVERVGKRGFGVLLTDVPLERFWKAINDEDHHAPYTAADHSEIVGGTVHGKERWVFQYASAFGTGRWWVARVAMSDDLYAASGGTLWELWWEDDLDAVDPASPPVADIADRLPPLRRSRGSWLLGRLAPDCTLVELFNWSEAGGVAGLVEGLAVERSLRTTMAGMERMAREHVPAEHAGAGFFRPDGEPLASPGTPSQVATGSSR